MICVNESAGFGASPVPPASVPTSDGSVGELSTAARLSEGGATAGLFVESAGDDAGGFEPDGEADADVPFGSVFVADAADFEFDEVLKSDEEPTDAV